jgi:DNA-directed DNA polymerase III PolC
MNKTLLELIKQSDRYSSLNEETKDALMEEYRFIIAQSLEGYFSTLAERNIKVSNTKNSLVAWAIGVTDDQPQSIETGRLQILEAGSTAVPDIDSDFSKHKRHLVKEHLIERYGQDRVASVANLGLLKTKVALRDVARALGYPYEVQDLISKTIDEEFMAGSQAVIKETVKQITQLVSDEQTSYKYPKTKLLVEQYPDIFDNATKIEGSPRQFGMHAAAVVITPIPMADCIPLRMQKKGGGEGLVTTQLDKNALEDLGILKADILGLESLAIMEDCMTLIQTNQGKKVTLEDIPFDDKKTWDTISEGQTLGSFQICTSGIRNICKQYKPQNVSDLGAIIAIYRPGPLENGMDKTLIRRKRGTEEVSYLKPAHKTKPILEDTLGVIVYQEQCMQIASAVAGYNPAEADVLRKVISKSKKEAMQAERGKFVKGCITNSHLSEQESNELFDLIETFGRYGFNKSHSISYAVLGYQMMYLKVNYPLEFMTAWFNNKVLERITAECIPEAMRLGIKVAAPDINRSLVEFTYDEKQLEIVFGLARIKGCGDSASVAILTDRKQNGPYEDLIELLTRVPTLNKKVLGVIAAAGGFKNMGYDREKVILYIEDIKAALKRKDLVEERYQNHKNKVTDIRISFKTQIDDLIQQIELEQDEALKKKLTKELESVRKKRDKAKDSAIKKGSQYEEELTQISAEIESLNNKMKGEDSLDNILKYEFEAIECHISAHPLDDPRILFMKKHLPHMMELDQLIGGRYSDGEKVLFPCILKRANQTIAKRSGKPMFVMTFEGRNTKTDSRAFGKRIEELKNKMKAGEIYIIQGTWSNKYGVDIVHAKSLSNFFRTTFADFAQRKNIDISNMLM